jgi:hypothetical protein
MLRLYCPILLFFILTSCSLLEKEEPSEQPLDIKTAVSKPLPPEKTKELLNETGSNWFYGQGLGETAVTAGAIFAFPPYAIYVVGNGVLSLSGYKQIRVSNALPEEERESYNSAYDSVTSAPGRMTAAIAGKEFRNKEVAKEKIVSILKTEEKK